MNGVLRCLTTLLLTVVACSGCGGGSGEVVARIGGGGTGAPIASGVGSVSGFGSIIVNGQHYDETAAQIAVDERPDQPTPASVSAVRLGMQIQFEHEANKMSRATVAAEVIGPVSSISASSLVVLGQTVRVNGDPASPTVFDGFTALTELAGAVVEVHGQRNSSAEIQATRIERRAASSILRVAGTATNVANGAFRIGGLTVRSAQATIVPAGQAVADGIRIAVWTDQPPVNGELVARVIRVGGPAIPNNSALTVEGLVTDYLSSSNLRVGGIAVDASAAQLVGGTAADLRNGRSVRATGTYSANVLRAARIEFRSTTAARTELSGSVTGFVDATSVFRVRDTATRVTSQTNYVRGDASNLGDGVIVKIEGPVVNGVVEATTLEFLPPPAGIARVLFGAVANPIVSAADKTKTFRLSPLPFEVRTTATTRFKKGAVEDIVLGAGVKVDGTYDGTLFVADEVQFTNNPNDPPTFSVEGIASNIQPTSVIIDGKTVALTPTTVYKRNDKVVKFEDLTNGAKVEIEAVKLNGTLYAVTVEIKELASGSASVRGIVSGRASDTATEFLVGSQRVSVGGSPQVVPGSKSLKDIKNGTDLEVDGTIANGLLTATRVKFR
jgi:hypothetical protein